MKNPTFIESYNNVFTKEECESVINYFNEMKRHNLVFSRQELRDGHTVEKDDETVFIFEPDSFHLVKTHPIATLLLDKIFDCYKQYAHKYSVLVSSKNHGVYGIRLQKTEIGGGFHPWHYENDGRLVSHRFVAWTVFLNDVRSGGETEFLYQNERCLAVQGKVLIWPAGFTHPHRGNPPLSGEKYIATGWVEFFE